MAYHSVGRKEEILPFAAAWMDLDDIMFSEISQTEKDEWCVVSLTCRKFKSPETIEKWLPGTEGWGGEIQRKEESP